MKKNEMFAAALWMQAGAVLMILLIEFGADLQFYMSSRSQAGMEREPAEYRSGDPRVYGAQPSMTPRTRQLRVVQMNRDYYPPSALRGKPGDGQDVQFILADAAYHED